MFLLLLLFLQLSMWYWDNVCLLLNKIYATTTHTNGKDKMQRFLLTCLALSTVQCVVHKTKQVVEFIIDDYHPGGEPIQTTKAPTRNKCMAICVRTRNCSAFNFRSEGGMCMLHPAYPNKICMAENFAKGFEFVHMTYDSGGVPPWRSLRTKKHLEHWKTNPTSKRGIAFVRSDWGGIRHVVRVLYKGIYLTGSGAGRMRVATLDGAYRFYQCGETMQYLMFSDYKWDVFYAGWDIPTNAIIGGYRSDGTPLYVVSATYGPGARYPGYYDPSTRKANSRDDERYPKLCILLNTSDQMSGPVNNHCWCI